MQNQKTIKGFKGFGKGLKCRDKQYAENTSFEEKENPVLCRVGMHFCPMPLDVFKFYPPEIGNEYAEVESEGNCEVTDDKVSTNKLKIKGKINIAALFKAHFEIIREKVKSSKEAVSTTGYAAHSSTTGYAAHSSTTGNRAHSSTTGDDAHSSTTGNRAHSSTTGNHAHSSTTGDDAHSSTTGNRAHSSTTGYAAHSSTTGDDAHSSTTGNRAHSSTTGNRAHSSTTGDDAHSSTTGNRAHSSTTGYTAHSSTTGENGISSGLGIHSRSSAKKGWIVIVDWRQDEKYNWFIKEIYRAKVGKHKVKGILIQPDISYWFEDGQLNSENLSTNPK